MEPIAIADANIMLDPDYPTITIERDGYPMWHEELTPFASDEIPDEDERQRWGQQAAANARAYWRLCDDIRALLPPERTEIDDIGVQVDWLTRAPSPWLALDDGNPAEQLRALYEHALPFYERLGQAVPSWSVAELGEHIAGHLSVAVNSNDKQGITYQIASSGAILDGVPSSASVAEIASCLGEMIRVREHAAAQGVYGASVRALWGREQVTLSTLLDEDSTTATVAELLAMNAQQLGAYHLEPEAQKSARDLMEAQAAVERGLVAGGLQLP